tara:strand:+ start:1308 stop:1532 length:225 start_codon:yes stop_codon:yes gene_type:complete
MTRNESEDLYVMGGGVLAFLVIFSSILVGSEILKYAQKTDNYQTSLKMITECRVRAKSSADDTCGKIPTWEQYK